MKPIVLVLVALLPACAGARQRTPELPEDVRSYGEGLRWQRLPEAAVHIPPREREDFLLEREELADDLRIADWEIERIDWAVPGKRATVRLRWTWHLDSRGLVHRTTTEQRWELYGKRWLMVAEAHRRGEPMPGVPEPPPRSPDARGARTTPGAPPAPAVP